MISKMIPFPKTSKEVKAFKNKALAIIATQLYKEYATADIDSIEVHLDRHQHLDLNEIFFVDVNGVVPVKGIYVKPDVMNTIRDEVAVKIEIPEETDEEGNVINPEAYSGPALIVNPGFQIGQYGNEISIIPVPLFPKEKYEMKGTFPEGMTNGDFIEVDKRLTDFSEKFAAVMKNTIFPALNKVEDLVPTENKDQTMYISFDVKTEHDQDEFEDNHFFIPQIMVCLDPIPNKSEEDIQIKRTPMDRYELPEEKLGAAAVHQLLLIDDAVMTINDTSLADVFTKCNFEYAREYAVEQFKVLVSKTIVKMHKPLYNVTREGAADELKKEYGFVLEMIREVTKAPQPEGVVAKHLDINAVTFWTQHEDGDRNACPASESAAIKAYLEKFEQGFGTLLLNELARTTDCVKEMVLISDRKEWQPGDKIGQTSVTMVDADGNPIAADPKTLGGEMDNSSGDPRLTMAEREAIAEELGIDKEDAALDLRGANEEPSGGLTKAEVNIGIASALSTVPYPKF